MAFEVVWTPNAREELTGVIDYIADDLAAPTAAARLLDDIMSRVDDVAGLPKCCPLSAEDRLAERGFRKIVVGSFLIFYSVDETMGRIVIHDFLNGRRSYGDLL
ncbi:MAG: type II toxin-antitoxin system RelE/ParE family toxin [Atopobiaceae bacterium]|jgi:plasmid stabilization system protein ParE|nr:type II toxin-antitoxin system RelE/ParE family toxin [Atopobiaceae bacterium]MCI2173819.1 type II toxin-antitoxin system RelE/ParE family toxin [Atopobiaceae bacterium]MCI2207539.1 type II toxin-antitoxin system RelE/ParE family toxin [Atopobiaceae bacterium]